MSQLTVEAIIADLRKSADRYHDAWWSQMARGIMPFFALEESPAVAREHSLRVHADAYAAEGWTPPSQLPPQIAKVIEEIRAITGYSIHKRLADKLFADQYPMSDIAATGDRDAWLKWAKELCDFLAADQEFREAILAEHCRGLPPGDEGLGRAYTDGCRTSAGRVWAEWDKLPQATQRAMLGGIAAVLEAERRRGSFSPEWCQQASATIESLREQLAEAEEKVNQLAVAYDNADAETGLREREIEQLRSDLSRVTAERDRAREAKKQISKYTKAEYPW